MDDEQGYPHDLGNRHMQSSPLVLEESAVLPRKRMIVFR